MTERQPSLFLDRDATDRAPNSASETALLTALFGEPISVLGLSVRPHNALMRAGINTVGQLVSAVVTETVREVRNIGERSYREILGRIEHVTGMDIIALIEEYQEGNHEHATGKPTQLDPAVVERIESRARQAALEEALSWLIPVIRKHTDFGLLHPRIAADSRTLEQLLNSPMSDGYSHYRTLLQVLTSFSVADDLQSLVAPISLEHLKNIVIPRYGLAGRTLQEVGDSEGVTRERIRQISQKAQRHIANQYIFLVSGSGAITRTSPAAGCLLAKVQTALLIAEDMGASISYSGWKQEVERSGLLGVWTDDRYSSIDVAEALIAVCQLLGDECPPVLRLPPNLVHAIDLASKGQPDSCANDLSTAELPKDLRRLIAQHQKHSGTVSTRWLSRETGLDRETVIDALGLLGYVLLEGDWYILPPSSKVNRGSKDQVFHRALRKMFQYCGPLEIEQICGGIRKVVHRKQFPAPPPPVMDKVLRLYGYAAEEGLYYWEGPSGEALSKSERVVFGYLVAYQGVVHHDELVRTFGESELSLQALHYALRRSPLFHRLEPGVHALRGKTVMPKDVQRAREADLAVPQDLQVRYAEGCIVVAINLSALAVTSGTITVTSKGFPNISGDWNLAQHKDAGRIVKVRSQRITGLSSVLSSQDVRPSDRIEMRFDPKNRTVTLTKVRVS